MRLSFLFNSSIRSTVVLSSELIEFNSVSNSLYSALSFSVFSCCSSNDTVNKSWIANRLPIAAAIPKIHPTGLVSISVFKAVPVALIAPVNPT